MISLRHFFFSLCFVISCLVTVQAQVISWQEHSNKTVVFKINDKEAFKLLKGGIGITELLHTPIDTFTGEWNRAPKQGHFIFAEVKKSEVKCFYVPIMPFQVFLFKEYGAFTLQIVNHEGNICDNASVNINSGWRLFNTGVMYDKESQTYTIWDNSEKQNRLLTIKHDGFTAVFDLQKHFVNRWYGSSYDYDDRPDFYSYMITDKNKYKPHEKVRFKSFALTGNKQRIRKDLEVWMTKPDYGYRRITTVSPYNPGGFAGEIELHDSLKLRLDKYYNIQLRTPKGRIVANTGFKYEDYELYDSKLEVKVRQDVQYFPDANQIEIKALDANGLHLQDVQAEVTIKRNRVLKSYTDVLSMPDVLMSEKIKLDNDKETIVNIPASLFGKTDCVYEVHVKLLTIDNQLHNYSRLVNFYSSHHAVNYTLRNDTIRFEYFYLGAEKAISAELAYNNAKEKKTVNLPYEEVFNQSVKSFHFFVPDVVFHKTIETSHIDPGIKVEGDIAGTTLNIELINPLKLDVSWYVYQGNVLVLKGSGNELKQEFNDIDLNVAHYVELFYFMGDKEKTYKRIFVPQTKYLTVDVDLPERVYPGMQTDATINVKNHYGDPVKNVDLTAMGFNSLLNYNVPDLPYYGKSPQSREQRDSYSIYRKNYSYTIPLKYGFWHQLAGLDSLMYYQFTYPRDTMFTHVVETPDSITQFAPFVMQNGKAVDIYIIERNGVPVYYSWTNQLKTYSFPALDKKQTITLRLSDRAVIIDSIRFEKGKKTIFSIDLDFLSDNARILNLQHSRNNYGYTLTPQEIATSQSYISEIPVYKEGYTYLKKDNNVYPLFHPGLMSNRGSVIGGPMPQDKLWYNDLIYYKHEGGFSYVYDDNVVYKYPANLYPENLRFASNNNFDYLNQFYLSPKVMSDELAKRLSSQWYPASIHILQNNLNLTFRLPQNTLQVGVSNLLFRSHETGRILYPDVIEYHTRSYSEIPEGTYDAILLYESGKYLERKNIEFKKHHYIEADLSHSALHDADSLSAKWLLLNTPASWGTTISYPTDGSQWGNRNARPNTQSTYFERPYNRPGINSVHGIVMDADGKELLIGVSVIIKGTSFGTITDIDGRFTIAITDPNTTLVFMYIGYNTQEVQVGFNSDVTVTLEADMQQLDEVVVVAYGVSRKSSLTGAVTHVDGAPPTSAAPESMNDDSKNAETDDAEEQLYRELMMLNGLRRNFSDVAFWKPDLVTDRKGEATFPITFPDNITKWNAVVYAMNRKLETGTYRSNIMSYKPLMAELKVPQFLVQGDSCYAAGYVRNYTKDANIHGNIMFAVGTDTLKNEDISFTTSHQEYMLITAPVDADSISSTYLFTRDDGYNDGELRSITIEKPGTERAEGTLSFMQNNQQIQVAANADEVVHVKIAGRQLDVYLDAVAFLTGYSYACNEQLASKLIGLINYKLYREFNGEKFIYDKNVNQIIRRLLANQNDKKLWSWWGQSSASSYWMSAHVLRALKMAKDAGYKVDLNIRDIQQEYMDTKRYRYSSIWDIQMLHALSSWGAEQNYADAVKMFQDQIAFREWRDDSIAGANKTKRYNSYLPEKLLLTEICQQQQLPYSPDSISRYLKKDALGAVYCDDGISRWWYYDNLYTTLIAYRVVKNDSTLQHLKEPMQMYVLGTKQRNWNTYQAASALSTIFPDLLAASYSKKTPATVALAGKENRDITEFPYETTLQPGEQLSIEKKNGMPLIYTSYSMKRATEAHPGEAFDISTRLQGGDTLIAGKPVTLEVTVHVKQRNAEHIMIEVPVPAGCSYASKPNYFYGREVHREYFKEKTVIFCEKLPEGEYKFQIHLLPRYSGRYTLNPAKVEMMYFPVVNANNDLRKIKIEKEE